MLAHEERFNPIVGGASAARTLSASEDTLSRSKTRFVGMPTDPANVTAPEILAVKKHRDVFVILNVHGST
jgi:hypothetical protein